MGIHYRGLDWNRSRVQSLDYSSDHLVGGPEILGVLILLRGVITVTQDNRIEGGREKFDPEKSEKKPKEMSSSTGHCSFSSCLYLK